MRDYGTVSPKFWIGNTGRQLRKMPYAQRIAMYLMTAPMAEMSGVFYCPVATILNDVGAPCDLIEAPSKGLPRGIEGVKEALKALESLNFCFYDFESVYVFVKEMAHWQIAEKLKPTDNRVKSIRQAVNGMTEPIKTRFLERYNEAFSLGFEVQKPALFAKPLASPSEAPSEPLRSQEQEQEQEQKKDIEEEGAISEKVADAPEPPFPDFSDEIPAEPLPEDWGVLDPEPLPPTTTRPAAKTKRGMRLDLKELPVLWRQWLAETEPDLDPDKTFEEFRDYWIAVPGAKGVKLDWFATFKNSVRSMPDFKRKNFRKKSEAEKVKPASYEEIQAIIRGEKQLRKDENDGQD